MNPGDSIVILHPLQVDLFVSGGFIHLWEGLTVQNQKWTESPRDGETVSGFKRHRYRDPVFHYF